MRDIYIKNHSFGAGKWIYKGYESAWKKKGFNPIFYNHLEEIDVSSDYDLMALDGDVNHQNLHIVGNSNRCYLYVQPNVFPEPWGHHPNFVSQTGPEIGGYLNNLENVYQWCFSQVTSYHAFWKQVSYIPLAFNSIDYKPIEDEEYRFDVCYVGGWANNGFNEKKVIMMEHFKAFKDTGLKCGFFINRDLSHEKEIKILTNSKVCLNIHDAYQRVLGLDTNERTYKSLGLNGCLVSDDVCDLNLQFPDVKTSSDPETFKNNALYMLNMDPDLLASIKEKNRLYIEQNHTYINRVESMLCL